jgi:hypothetical protein
VGEKRSLPIAKLVRDFRLYPRTAVDMVHVGEMLDALKGDATFPPIVVDAKSFRVVDGFHRLAMYEALAKKCDDKKTVPTVEVEVRTYDNEREMYLDAVRLNAAHGRNISGHERTACILKAAELDIRPELVAAALSITKERVQEIVAMKTALVTPSGSRMALKRSVAHMAGQTLTSGQAKVMGRLPGQAQSLLLMQVCDLIQHHMLNLKDPRVRVQVARLKKLLRNVR